MSTKIRQDVDEIRSWYDEPKMLEDSSSLSSSSSSSFIANDLLTNARRYSSIDDHNLNASHHHSDWDDESYVVPSDKYIRVDEKESEFWSHRNTRASMESRDETNYSDMYQRSQQTKTPQQLQEDKVEEEENAFIMKHGAVIQSPTKQNKEKHKERVMISGQAGNNKSSRHIFRPKHLSMSQNTQPISQETSSPKTRDLKRANPLKNVRKRAPTPGLSKRNQDFHCHSTTTATYSVSPTSYSSSLDFLMTTYLSHSSSITDIATTDSFNSTFNRGIQIVDDDDEQQEEERQQQERRIQEKGSDFIHEDFDPMMNESSTSIHQLRQCNMNNVNHDKNHGELQPNRNPLNPKPSILKHNPKYIINKKNATNNNNYDNSHNASVHLPQRNHHDVSSPATETTKANKRQVGQRRHVRFALTNMDRTYYYISDRVCVPVEIIMDSCMAMFESE